MATQRRSLSRVLGLADLSILASASMAPAYSIAVTFGAMVAAAGAGAPLSLVALTIPIVFIAIAFHRLCEEHPDAGSTYAWSRLAFGPGVGAFGAWVVVLSYFFAAVAAVVPAGIYTLDLATQFHLAPQGLADNALAVAFAGCAWVAVASALLIGGIRPTARVSGLFLLFECLVLIGFAAFAFGHPLIASASRPNPLSMGNRGFDGFLGAMVLAVWATDGWEVSSYSSEENKGGSRVPGIGGLVGLIVTVVLILVCMVAFTGIASLTGLAAHQADSLAYVAAMLGGGWLSTIMVATVLVSTAATLWTTQLGISRGIFSMARDRLFPSALTAVHPAFGTPYIAIAAVNAGVFCIAMLTGLLPSASDALNHVVNSTAILLNLTFILTGASCVVHFVRNGTPVTDVTRVILPAIGTVAIAALLDLNFRSQAVLDQRIAVVTLVLGIGYAWLIVLLGRTKLAPKVIVRPSKAEG
ncbi:MAG TPA: APC family permease [Vicinamibacterales bacterium]|nr:APC family permease [Vicinamibacterales bacterium]